jgi:SH3-like domain-containing protein
MVTEGASACRHPNADSGCMKRQPDWPNECAVTRYSGNVRFVINFERQIFKSLVLKLSRHISSRVLALAWMVAAVLTVPACNRSRHRVLEVAYVSAPQAVLRDQVAAIYNRVGNVKNGERLEVLEREKRFARVRTATGIEGWIEQRYLVDQKTYDGLQALTQSNRDASVQAPGVLRNDTNMHVTPGRETEHLYQLSAGAKVALLKRATADKQSGAASATAKPGTKVPSGPALEDWWLVRDNSGRVGWVLSRMVDVDAPLDIAQYAEGQRFVAFFTLDEVLDKDKEKDKKVPDNEKRVPEYLCVLTESRDGLPYDFDQIRVFTWNVRKHRYETAYREHALDGVLPVTVTKENFDKEGTLPVFILRVKDDTGKVIERKYKMNTPMVRRVLAPGEEALKQTRPGRRSK